MTPDAGIPGWFIALFVLAILISVGTWLWRIAVARQIAEDAGLDGNQAARAAMFSKDGVDATYLASTLAARTRAQSPTQPERAKSSEQRLRELQALKDQGLVSAEEYDAQRRKILDSI